MDTQAIANGSTITLSGRGTYAIREYLKQAGLTFSGAAKCWTGTLSCWVVQPDGRHEGFALSVIRRAVAAGDVTLGRPGAAPASSWSQAGPRGGRELSWDC